MRKLIMNKSTIILLAALMSLVWTGCERDIDELEEARFPANGEVFIDDFSAGLGYAAFAGSKPTAFDVDQTESYAGSASMKFQVPSTDDPEGQYAGGTFFALPGRDLSGFDVLTFWGRASESINVDEIGFGVDDAGSPNRVVKSSVPMNTNWQKYYIPLPDPSRLTQEIGMFFYSESAENGTGYTFWIDEVRFEKSGALAHIKPGILLGQDQVIDAETGDRLDIGGFYIDYNLPTGVTERAGLSPSYFDFTTSNTSVAMVNAQGQVSVIDSGMAVITATVAGQDAEGSLTVNSSGDPIAPPTPAPTPTPHPDSVISLFSNAYEDVTVDTWDTNWEFSEAELTDIQVNGDDIKRYKKLNFVGIEFTSETVDASEMTHFHLDLWTPDPTDMAQVFRVLLVDFGANGTFDGGDDVSHELTFSAPLLETENWVSIDVPLSDFAGLVTREHLAQLVLSGDLPNVFIDNVYFYKAEAQPDPVPTEGAPDPTRDPADVISIFSDTYMNVPNTDFNPNWGQATVVTQEDIAGNNTLVYTGLNYQGVALEAGIDVTEMTHLHIDYWTANSTLLNTFLISPGPVETAKGMTVPTSGWAGIDIPLSDFDPVDLADVFQFKFEGNGTIYLDNIYFYKDQGGGGVPTDPAPTPTQAAADVISVYSDAYTNLPNTDFNPNWGQATVVTEEQIMGNNTLLYTGLNYQGIMLEGSTDVSSMTHLHVDFWTANSDALNVFLISPGGVETPVALSVPTNGWGSIDIELGDFAPVDLADLIQFKFDGNGDVYLDNIYFYDDNGGGGGMPTVPAPDPMQDEADVISVYSDAYTNLPNTDFNPNWGQATVVTEEQIMGNNTLLYTGLNYQGIMLEGSTDVSSMTHLHVDFWTANSDALNVFLISPGGIETPVALGVPTNGWSSIDIELGDFAPVDLADLIQFKFDGNGDIYLDNIYFYDDSPGGTGSPTEGAPDPTHPEADVISIFSDAYTDVAGTDLNPNWGQATVVTQEQIMGNNTLVYTGLNYQGITLAGSIDVSGMTHLHLDVWTENSDALSVFLISPGPVETPSAISVPTSGWLSLEIPLEDFDPVDLADLFQFKFEGNGDIYIDNIYFHK
jgi:hypothetical protein